MRRQEQKSWASEGGNHGSEQNQDMQLARHHSDSQGRALWQVKLLPVLLVCHNRTPVQTIVGLLLTQPPANNRPGKAVEDGPGAPATTWETQMAFSLAQSWLLQPRGKVYQQLGLYHTSQMNE